METKTTTRGDHVNLEEPFRLKRWLNEKWVCAGLDRPGLRTPVWIQGGPLGLMEAEMQAMGDRLALGIRAMPLFDVSMGHLTNVRFTWWGLGSGIRFDADGETWRLSFVGPAEGPLPMLSELCEGRSRARRWMSIFRGSARSDERTG